MVHKIIFVLSLIIILGLDAVPVSWVNISIAPIEHDGDYSFHECHGLIYNNGSAVGELSQMLWGHYENGDYYLKMFDYGNPMISVSANSSWVLAYYAQVLGADSFDTFQSVAVGDYGTETTGGTMLGSPSDFYLGFKTWNEGDDQNWYGWLHLSYDAAERLTLLGSGVGLSGLSVIVGGGSATPEPSSAILFLLGTGILALSRRREMLAGDGHLSA